MKHFHTLPVTETLAFLKSSPEGLSHAEAAGRLAKEGPNELPEAKSKGVAGIFFEQFKNPIIYILLIASIVSFALGEFSDGYFILGVLLINAVIGTYQEYSAGRRADALKRSVRTVAMVRREGRETQIDAAGLVRGDIVLLESGSKVPADLRLIASQELRVNESLLTGESVEVPKNADALFEEHTLPLGDRANLGFAGTFVTGGRAVGTVTATATETEIGKIARLLSQEASGKAPLVARMERFSLKIAYAIGAICSLMILLGTLMGIPLRELFFLSVALAVSSIPEGLPVAITVALSVASSAMAKRNVIIRKLPAIEGLGSTTVILTDKTGTLTMNRLKVERFVTPYRDNDPLILRAMLVANEARFSARDQIFLGDQVDAALAEYAATHEDAFEAILHAGRSGLIAYESQNRYSAASIEQEDGSHFAAIKGSPETILAMCDLDADKRPKIEKSVENWAAKGFRTIALAYRHETRIDRHTRPGGFSWLGFAVIADPLREGVETSVKRAMEAGLEVAMITGDHPLTATHIARELGIAVDKDALIDGVALTHWAQRGADPKAIADKRVFARVSPEQKLQIVKAFRELGHFVAVTGDGVNDAPALKYANIGIAMGLSGTDVARESADMILADDAFTSIVSGIEEGRAAYDNIRKVIHLLISTGFAEIILVLLSLASGLPLPLLPVQLLWLNLVTNGIQDVALGFEKAEPGLLKRPPRPPREPIFNTVMLQRIAVGGLYMAIGAFVVYSMALSTGQSVEEARNVTLLLMVLFENMHVFNSRTESRMLHRLNHWQNPLLLLSVFITQAIHIGAMNFPLTQNLLELQPVGVGDWAELLLLAAGLVLVMEATKLLYLKRRGPARPIYPKGER